MMARIALAQLGHEATVVEHGGTHLLLALVLIHVATETASSCLIEFVRGTI